MRYKNYNFEIIERIRREIDLENGKILINIVVFTKHVTRSVVYICRSKNPSREVQPRFIFKTPSTQL